MKEDKKYYGYMYQDRLDICPEDVVKLIDDVEELPDACFPIKVYVYKQKDISFEKDSIAENALNNVLYHLDEEYSDPDGDYTEPTEAMKKASLAFAKAVIGDYHPWGFEKTGDVVEYSREEAEKIIYG